MQYHWIYNILHVYMANYGWRSYLWGYWENYHTRLIQGFLLQFIVSVACFNAALSVYYIFYIQLGWMAQWICLCIEPFLHFVPMMIATSTAIMGLVLNLYNNGKPKCWISPLVSSFLFIWCVLHPSFLLCITHENTSNLTWSFFHQKPHNCKESWKNNGFTNCIWGIIPAYIDCYFITCLYGFQLWWLL